MIKHALHRDHDHCARRLVVDNEALLERRIGRNAGTANDANRFADAGNEKQQRDARIANDVAQRVDAIVAAAVGNEQRLFIGHAHKTRCVAARRAIEPFRPAGRQREERRRLDEFSIGRIDVVDLFDDRRAVRLTIERGERFERGDAMIAAACHVAL